MEKYYTFYKIKLIMEHRLDIELYNIFFNDGNCYQCIEGVNCADCGLKPDSELCKRFFCKDYTRKDNTNVVFKKLYRYPNFKYKKIDMETLKKQIIKDLKEFSKEYINCSFEEDDNLTKRYSEIIALRIENYILRTYNQSN